MTILVSLLLVFPFGNPIMCCVLCLVAQACQTLCDPIDSNSPGYSVHRDSPGQNTGVGCQALLHEIFLIQGLNPGLPHCRWVLYCLRHHGSPIITILIRLNISFVLSHFASKHLSTSFGICGLKVCINLPSVFAKIRTYLIRSVYIPLFYMLQSIKIQPQTSKQISDPTFHFFCSFNCSVL